MSLLTVSEVCEQLSVSRPWVYRAARDGKIPSVRLGGEDGPLRFVQADLDDWLAQARAAWRPGQTSAQTLNRVQDQDAA